MKNYPFWRRVLCGVLSVVLSVSLCVPTAFAEAGTMAAETTTTQTTTPTTTSDPAAETTTTAPAAAPAAGTGAAPTTLNLADCTSDMTVTINGLQGQVTVGNTFSLVLNYTLKNEIDGQKAASYLPGKQIVYKLPAGIVFAQKETGNTTFGTDVYGTYTVDGDTLTLVFSDALNSFSGNMKGTVTLNAALVDDGTGKTVSGEYDFGGTGGKIIINQHATLTGGKSWALDTATGEIIFKIPLKADAYAKNVMLRDVMGSYFTFKQGSFDLTDASGAVLKANLSTVYATDGHTATVTVGDLAADTQYYVVYRATVNSTAAAGDTNPNVNTVYWTGDNTTSGSASVTLSYGGKTVEKAATGLDNKKDTVTWTVTLNAGLLREDLSNFTFTDTLTAKTGPDQVWKKGAKATITCVDNNTKKECTATVDNDWDGLFAALKAAAKNAPYGKYTLVFTTTSTETPVVGTAHEILNTFTMKNGSLEFSAEATKKWDTIGTNTPQDSIKKSLVTNAGDYGAGSGYLNNVSYANNGLLHWKVAVTKVNDTAAGSLLLIDQFTCALPTAYVAGSAKLEYKASGETKYTVLPAADYTVTADAKDPTKFTVNLTKAEKAGTYNFYYDTKTTLPELTDANKPQIWNKAWVVANGTSSSDTIAWSNAGYKTPGGVTWNNGVCEQTWNIGLNDHWSNSVYDFGSSTVTAVDQLPEGLSYARITSISLLDPAGIKTKWNNATWALAMKELSNTTNAAGETVITYTPDGSDNTITVTLTISADKRTLTWSMPNAGKRRLYVTFVTSMDANGPFAAAYANLKNNEELTFTNELNVAVDGTALGKLTASQSTKRDLIAKVATQTNASGKQDAYITYTVKVNPRGETLATAANMTSLVLTDKIDTNFGALVLTGAGRLRVYDGDTSTELTDKDGVSYTYENGLLTITLPNSRYCRVVYCVLPSNPQGANQTTNNTATLKGLYEYTVTIPTKYKVVTSGSTIQGDSNAVIVQKVDASDASKVLKDAVFEAWRVDDSAVDANGVPLAQKVDEQKTDALGEARFAADSSEQGKLLTYDKLYYLVETTAPDGYLVNSTKYFFVLTGKTEDEAWADVQSRVEALGGTRSQLTVVNNANRTLTIPVTDEVIPTPTDLVLTAQKTVKGSGDKVTRTLTFALAEDAANNPKTLTGTGAVSVTIPGDGKQTVTFPTLHYTQKGTYHYTIQETSTNAETGLTNDTGVWDVTVEVTADASHQLVAKPTYYRTDYGQTVEQDSIWFSNNGGRVFGMARRSVNIVGTKTLDGALPADGQFRFELLDAPEGNVVATAKNDAAGQFSFRRGYASAAVTTYYVRESNYGSTIDGISYSNDLYKVDITADPNGGTPTVAYAVARDYYAAAAGAQPAFAALAAGETMTFANTGVTRVLVNKVWSDTANPQARPLNVTVHLYANGTDTSKSLTLTAPAAGGDTWTGSFDNLPVHAADGSAIVYTVQEDAVPCYTGAITDVTDPASTGVITFQITNTLDEGSLAMAAFSIQKKLQDVNGVDAGTMHAGEFTFGLYEVDGNGVIGTAKLAEASNLEDGTVLFPVRTFAQAGTYRYAIVETAGTDPQIGYSADPIYVTVTVAADAGGASLSSTVQYTDKNGTVLASTDAAGTTTGTPVLVNTQYDMVLRIQKTSRNSAAVPLEGAMYGLYKVNAAGTGDILVTKATSGADGYMYFREGLELMTLYYVKEIEPPDGYIVDPYPSDTFYLYRDGNGQLCMTYAASVPSSGTGGSTGGTAFRALRGASVQLLGTAAAANYKALEAETPDEVSGLNVVNGNGVSDPVAQVKVYKIDKNTNAPLAGCTLQIIEQATGSVISEWTSGTSGNLTQLKASYKDASGKMVYNYYILREIKAPNGYDIEKTDTVFYINSDGSQVTVTQGPASALNNTNTLNIADAQLPITVTKTLYRTIVRQIVRNTAPQTGDSAPIAAALAAVAAGLSLLIYEQRRRRR